MKLNSWRLFIVAATALTFGTNYLWAATCDYVGDAMGKARQCLQKVAKQQFGIDVSNTGTGGTIQSSTSSGSDLFLVQLSYSEIPGQHSVTGLLECNEKTGKLEVKSISYFIQNSYGVLGSGEICN